MDRETLLARVRGELITFEVPEWHATLKLKKLSAHELEAFRKLLPDKTDEAEESADAALDFASLAFVLACCVVGDDYLPILSAEEWDAGRTIESTPVMMRIVEAIYQHSGLTGDPIKNSETGPSTAST